MRVLLAAALVARGRSRLRGTAAAGAHDGQTLYAQPVSGTISAFAQDGPLIAWFTPESEGPATRCTCAPSRTRLKASCRCRAARAT